MMGKLKIFLFLILFSVSAQAQEYPVSPSNYITDEAGVLDDAQESNLNARLKAFEDSTSNQIFVYIGKSLNGRVMSDLCQEIFHNWKIGTEGKDNGVLVAIFVEDHKFRIHTGYGLEGALPDILTKKIQDKDMKPHFKTGDYFTGIENGVNSLIYYSRHEYVASGPAKKQIFSEGSQTWILAYAANVILLLINIILLYNGNKHKNTSKKGKGWRVFLYVLTAAIPCAGAIFLFIMMFTLIIKSNPNSNATPGSYRVRDEDNGSSSWSSSDSGSDFSGGGGGDSGGGGSDSDW